MDPWGVVHDSPGTASRHTPCRKMVCTLHTIMRTAGCARVGWEYARAHAWPRPWRPCGICGIYIYMYIGVGEPQWQVGPRVVIWIAVEYPRWCSLAKIGRLDIKRGCIFFFKLFIELDDFRKIANRHFSSFRIPIFIDDWVIYKTKVLNLSNCIDILKFLFSKRNLLIDNGGVEFWESKKPPPKVSQRRAHPIAPNRAWPLSGSCSTHQWPTIPRKWRESSEDTTEKCNPPCILGGRAILRPALLLLFMKRGSPSPPPVPRSQ